MLNRYYSYLAYPMYIITFVMLAFAAASTTEQGLPSLSFVFLSSFELVVFVACLSDFIAYSARVSEKSKIGLYSRITCVAIAFILFWSAIGITTAVNVRKGAQFKQKWEARPVMPNVDLSYVTDSQLKKAILIQLGGQNTLGSRLFIQNVAALQYKVPAYVMHGLILQSQYVNRLQKHQLINQIPKYMHPNSFPYVSVHQIMVDKRLAIPEYVQMSNSAKRRYARDVGIVNWASGKGYNNLYLAGVIPVRILLSWENKLPKNSGFSFSHWLYSHLTSASTDRVRQEFTSVMQPYSAQIECEKNLGSLCKPLKN